MIYLQVVGKSKGNFVKILREYKTRLEVMSIKYKFPYWVLRKDFERYYKPIKRKPAKRKD